MFYYHHTNRGGRGGLTVKRKGRVLSRVLECALIYSHPHIVANGFPRRVGRTNAGLYDECDLTSDITDDVISADVAITSSRCQHANNTNKRCKSVTGKQIRIRPVTHNQGSDTRPNQSFAAVVESNATAPTTGAAAGRAANAGCNIRRTGGATFNTFCGTKGRRSDCTSAATFVHRSTFRSMYCFRSNNFDGTIYVDRTISLDRCSMSQVLPYVLIWIRYPLITQVKPWFNRVQPRIFITASPRLNPYRGTATNC